MKTKTFKHRLLAVGASIALGLGLSTSVQAQTLIIDDFNAAPPVQECVDGAPVDSHEAICSTVVNGSNIVMNGDTDWVRTLSADLAVPDKIAIEICPGCEAGHYVGDAGGSQGVVGFIYEGPAMDLSNNTGIVKFLYAADLDGGVVTITFSDGVSDVVVNSGALPSTGSAAPSDLTPIEISLPSDPVFSGVVKIMVEISGIGVPNLDFTIDQIEIPIGGKSGDFLCYKSFGSFLRQEVNLVDQFDDVNFDVLKPKMFCNPAIKPVRHPDVGMENPDAHLLSYKINEAHREPRHERQSLLMRDQFFTALPIQTVNPDRLMVPSGKSLDGTVPADQADAINHFKCYRVRPLAGFQSIAVNVADQFTDPDLDLSDPLANDVDPVGKDLVLVRPTRMCTPVSKNDEGIVVDPDADPADPRDHLMCYRVKADRGVRLNRRTEVTSNNQFRDEDLVLKRELEFCAPATKTVITGGLR